MEQPTLKSGSQTSEYKLSLIGQLIGTGLIGVGFLSGQNDQNLNDAIVMIIGGLINVYFGGSYILGRSNVKAAMFEKK